MVLQNGILFSPAEVQPQGLDHLQDILDLVVDGPKVGKPWPAGDWRALTLPMYCLPLGTMFKRMVLPVIK